MRAASGVIAALAFAVAYGTFAGTVPSPSNVGVYTKGKQSKLSVHAVTQHE